MVWIIYAIFAGLDEKKSAFVESLLFEVRYQIILSALFGVYFFWIVVSFVLFMTNRQYPFLPHLQGTAVPSVVMHADRGIRCTLTF